jgi:hypothetical protein
VLRIFLLFSAATLLGYSAPALPQTVQEHVHGHGREVMSFDLAKTVHIFKMTKDGGTQKVIVRDKSSGSDQIQKIQSHLSMEATEFQKGNFADPIHLHGSTMPGLSEMRSGAQHMTITYKALPNGAEIQFRANDIESITAIHRWFGAQLSEHGADARPE